MQDSNNDIYRVYIDKSFPYESSDSRCWRLINPTSSCALLPISQFFIHVYCWICHICVTNRVAAHSHEAPSATRRSDIVPDLLRYIFGPMRHIQALDASVGLLIASDSSLLSYIVYFLHVIRVHLTVELFVVHWQQVVQADHVGETVHLLVLLLLRPAIRCLLIEWSVFLG